MIVYEEHDIAHRSTAVSPALTRLIEVDGPRELDRVRLSLWYRRAADNSGGNKKLHHLVAWLAKGLPGPPGREVEDRHFWNPERSGPGGGSYFYGRLKPATGRGINSMTVGNFDAKIPRTEFVWPSAEVFGLDVTVSAEGWTLVDQDGGQIVSGRSTGRAQAPWLAPAAGIWLLQLGHVRQVNRDLLSPAAAWGGVRLELLGPGEEGLGLMDFAGFGGNAPDEPSPLWPDADDERLWKTAESAFLKRYSNTYSLAPEEVAKWAVDGAMALHAEFHQQAESSEPTNTREETS